MGSTLVTALVFFLIGIIIFTTAIISDVGIAPIVIGALIAIAGWVWMLLSWKNTKK